VLVNVEQTDDAVTEDRYAVYGTIRFEFVSARPVPSTDRRRLVLDSGDDR
jgi:hypothetical protein